MGRLLAAAGRGEIFVWLFRFGSASGIAFYRLVNDDEDDDEDDAVASTLFFFKPSI